MCLQRRPELMTLDFVFGWCPPRCPHAARAAWWRFGTERRPSPFVRTLFSLKVQAVSTATSLQWPRLRRRLSKGPFRCEPRRTAGARGGAHRRRPRTSCRRGRGNRATRHGNPLRGVCDRATISASSHSLPRGSPHEPGRHGVQQLPHNADWTAALVRDVVRGTQERVWSGQTGRQVLVLAHE